VICCPGVKVGGGGLSATANRTASSTSLLFKILGTEIGVGLSFGTVVAQPTTSAINSAKIIFLNISDLLFFIA
jgi:hypothetical protein